MRYVTAAVAAVALVWHWADVGAQQPAFRTHTTTYAAPQYQSAGEWKTRAAYLREHILASAGLLPMPERTALHPVVFGELKHEDYTVSKVYFESLPGFFVTGNLYRPVGAGPFPAILSPHIKWRCNHWPICGINSLWSSPILTASSSSGYSPARSPFSFFS